MHPFHMRETHIDPKTLACTGYADTEFASIGNDPNKLRFGDIVERGCSAPSISYFRKGPNKCWVVDYKWSYPIVCESDWTCGPDASWLSVYSPHRLSNDPTGGGPSDPGTSFGYIMRANADIT